MRQLLLLVAISIVLVVTSCTPKSAMMTKAVILDSKPRTTDTQTWYYVKLLTYDVKDRVVMYGSWDVGDTILIHDRWRNYEIR